MPKWFYGEYGGVNVDDGDYHEEVEHLGDALRLHNADIDALTARAEAAERALALSEHVRSISVRADAYEQKCRQLEAAEKRLASVLDRVGYYVSDSCYCEDLDGDRCEHCEFLRDLRRFAKGDGATEIVTRHNPDIDAMTARAEAAEAERDELRRRIDAVLAMLHLSSSTIHDNWVGYCSACWWRGDARCADWTEDSSGGMQPECPICGASVDEIPSYTHSVAFYEHARDIAEGRNHE